MSFASEVVIFPPKVIPPPAVAVKVLISAALDAGVSPPPTFARVIVPVPEECASRVKFSSLVPSIPPAILIFPPLVSALLILVSIVKLDQ